MTRAIGATLVLIGSIPVAGFLWAVARNRLEMPASIVSAVFILADLCCLGAASIFCPRQHNPRSNCTSAAFGALVQFRFFRDCSRLCPVLGWLGDVGSNHD
jgi:hypothetical protein